MTDVDNATREVFGNIAPWMQILFFVMIAASLGVLLWQAAARVWLWRKGQPGGFERDWRVWMERLAVYAAAQKRVHRKSLGALLHWLLFSGFVVLTIGTILLGIAYDGPYYFHHGWDYLFYELAMDVFGVAFILSFGLTGFALEALRMHYTQVRPPIAYWSTVGWLIDVTLLRGIDVGNA